MNQVGNVIVKRRILIVIVIAVILAATAYAIGLTNINSDIMSYLPKGTDTYEGSAFFAENFALESNAVYAVKGDSPDTYEKLYDAVEEAKENRYITDILWVGTADGLPVDSVEGGEKTKKKIEDLFRKDGNYLLIVSMNVGASTNEAEEALRCLNDALGDLEYVAGGTSPLSRKVYNDAIGELPIYLVVAIILVLIILFLVSANYLEPIVFMVTMGVSIVINMGTNFFFPEISIITFCAASILQLALAMDYSIFLTQIYSEETMRGIPMEKAMVTAIGTTFKTVLASGLTTMGGFAAFFVMSFTLGADLGGVLIKGIFLAMLTVLVLQPCLLIILNKPMKKTGHRRLIDLRFRRLAKFSVRHRVIIVILFSLLLIPAFLGQYFLSLSYLNFLPKMEGDPTLVSYVSETSNQLFLAVPVDEEDAVQNVRFVEKVEKLEGVSGVTGFYAFLPEEAFDENGEIRVKDSSWHIDAVELGKSFGYITPSGYTMYMVSLTSDNGVESLSATAILEEVKALANEMFDGKVYSTGVVQAVTDFRELTPRDFRWITIISVVIIFCVLLLTFRNFVYPFLLVLLIELGTWINFSLSTIFGQSLNFLAYIVVGAIQLGATVDYAILVTTRYVSLRKDGKDPLFAAYESGTSCTMSILTSASILIAACASVTLISSNAVIGEITMMCMRGALISTLLVLFVLPSLLACTSRVRHLATEAGGMHALTKKFIVQANAHIHDFAALKKAKKRMADVAMEDEAVEDLETRGLLILQKKKGYRFNSDSVILANLVEAEKNETVVDLGCGSGVIGLLVQAKRNARVVGVELQPALADMAKRTVYANALQDRMQIVQGDIREIEQLLPARYADRVVVNPPYYKTGSGDVNRNEEQAIARHEIAVTFAEVIAAMKYLLKEDGVGYFILPCEREKEANRILTDAGFSVRKKTYLTASADKSADSFIVECVLGAVEKTDIVTLVTKNEEMEMSEEVRALYLS